MPSLVACCSVVAELDLVWDLPGLNERNVVFRGTLLHVTECWGLLRQAQLVPYCHISSTLAAGCSCNKKPANCRSFRKAGVERGAYFVSRSSLIRRMSSSTRRVPHYPRSHCARVRATLGGVQPVPRPAPLGRPFREALLNTKNKTLHLLCR